MLCKELPADLIRVYSRDEYKQKHSFHADHIRYVIGDVRDRERLDMAMEDIDIVIHVAALKQIDTGEYNPFDKRIASPFSDAEKSAMFRDTAERVYAIGDAERKTP